MSSPKIPLNRALLFFNNTYGEVVVRFLSSQCYDCDPISLVEMKNNSAANQTFDTRWSSTLYVSTRHNGTWNDIYAAPSDIGEFGVYRYYINTRTGVTREVLTDPTNSIYSLLVPLFVTFAVWAVLNLVFSYREQLKYFCQTIGVSRVSDVEAAVEKPAPRGGLRVVGLDVFRGMCLCIMIFANYGGGGFWWLDHSRWYGLTVADLVFPWFIWIMGVAMPISFRSLKRKKVSRGVILQRVAVRSLKLWALGNFVNSPFDLSVYRVMGVLQRFSISYFFVSIILLFVPEICTEPSDEETSTLVRSVQNDDDGVRSRRVPGFVADLLPHALQFGAALLIVVMWLVITFTIPYPRDCPEGKHCEPCPTGYIGPGGNQGHGKFKGCTGGIAGFIDRAAFGKKHVYNDPTSNDGWVYASGPFDPEGLLGCLTSIVLCFLGTQAGRIITTYTGTKDRMIRWFIWGVVLGGIGTALANGSEWTGVIPICKNLWSLSFIFVMAGTGFLALCLCHFIVDIRQAWSGFPFLFPGSNSIIIYFGSEMFDQKFPLGGWAPHDNHWSYMFSNLFGISMWIVVGWALFANGVFFNL